MHLFVYFISSTVPVDICIGMTWIARVDHLYHLNGVDRMASGRVVI